MQGGPLVLPIICESTFVKPFLRSHRNNIHVDCFLLGWFEKDVLYTVNLKQWFSTGVGMIKFQRGREP